MRTPLNTVVFYAKQIEEMVEKEDQDKSEIAKNFKLVFCQTTLMETFIDDMLDFGYIKAGVFTLNKSYFDPKKELALVCDIFKP